ncbi:hypothetical protein CEXT_781001 [Caerostris extrusa]|uniref:Uncharacterized protein n=1 Tax=Caerostris extrusa TaxID=172846 RepID=A0AAV4TQD3_CAEEX|nr:hypothetical protein CEXT_781001 [Caerostris extrusa]
MRDGNGKKLRIRNRNWESENCSVGMGIATVCMTKRRKSAFYKTGTQSVAMVTNVIQRRKRREHGVDEEKDTRGPLYRLLVRPSS